MDKTKNEDYRSAFFTLLLAAASVFISVFFLPAVIFLPALLAYAIARNGYLLGGLVIALCLMGIYLLSPVLCLIISALFLPPALAAGYMIRSHARFFNKVLVASGASLLGIALSTGATWLLANISPADYITGAIVGSLAKLSEQNIKWFYSIFRSADVLSGAITQTAVDATPPSEAIGIIRNMLSISVNTLLVSFMVIFALMTGLLSVVVPISRAKKYGVSIYVMPRFSEYRLPKRFWLAFVLSYAAARLGEGFGFDGFDILGITVFNVYSFIFIVQGLSLLDYFYKTRNIRVSSRVILHFLTAFMAGLVLVIIGLIENMSNLRKRFGQQGGAAT